MKDIKLGSMTTKEQIVEEKDLACNVGSGIVHVFATPMMVALMENAAATCLAQFLEDGETSVGVLMNTTHDAATPLGMNVSATAEIIKVDRKKVSFAITAKDEIDIIGVAQHDRFIVNKDSFETRAQTKASN